LSIAAVAGTCDLDPRLYRGPGVTAARFQPVGWERSVAQ